MSNKAGVNLGTEVPMFLSCPPGKELESPSLVCDGSQDKRSQPWKVLLAEGANLASKVKGDIANPRSSIPVGPPPGLAVWCVNKTIHRNEVDSETPSTARTPFK